MELFETKVKYFPKWKQLKQISGCTFDAFTDTDIENVYLKTKINEDESQNTNASPDVRT